METKLDLSNITIGGEDDHMGGYEFSAGDTITLSSSGYNNRLSAGTLGPFTISGGTGINTSPYTISSNGTNTSPWYSQTTSSKIRLDGADADIEVNGISLLKTMQEIQSRLNLLQPNTALEAEWQELFELGRKYRELEQQIKEKQATWDRLKAMPPSEIE
jgi:hypothetical protein